MCGLTIDRTQKRNLSKNYKTYRWIGQTGFKGMAANNEFGGYWQGSIATMQHVAEQIAERFGQDAAKRYDPTVNCFTYNRWKAEGYQVRKGEKALKSVTWVPKIDKETGETVGKFPKTVNLFFIDQVDKVDAAAVDTQKVA